MNELLRDRIFFFICLCLPFLFIPQVYQLNFLGGPIGSQAIVYPIIVSFVVTVLYGKRNPNIFSYKDVFCGFAVVYVMILLCSTINGLIIYPYYDLIFDGPANQIRQLVKVTSVLNELGIAYNNGYMLAFGIVTKSLKSIILDLIYTFFFSYVIYTWFRKSPVTAVLILKRTVYIISAIIIAYSCVEISSFFGYDWAKEVLMKVNPILHPIKVGFGWWPPLLWPDRVRSIFPEPSWFGMYVGFILPYLWLDIFNKENVIVSTILILLLTILLFLSAAKTSSMLLLGELVLLVMYSFVRNNRKFHKQCLYIYFVTIIAFALSLLCVSNYSSQESKSENGNVYQHKIVALADKHIKDNVTGTTNVKSGSNSARFALIKSDMRIFLDYPFLGVGNTLKVAYNREYLTEEERKVPELANCISLQNKFGIMRTGFPSPSEYSKRLAENGACGLIIYILPFGILIYMYWKKRKQLFSSYEQSNIHIVLLISLFGCLAGGMSCHLTTLQSSWIVLGIGYAFIDKGQ